jgi:hypothetical protein
MIKTSVLRALFALSVVGVVRCDSSEVTGVSFNSGWKLILFIISIIYSCQSRWARTLPDALTHIAFAAFAASVVGKIKDLMATPWGPLGAISAAFNSGSDLMKGGARMHHPYQPHHVRKHAAERVDHNKTRRFLWTQVKATAEDTALAPDSLGLGLTTGSCFIYLPAITLTNPGQPKSRDTPKRALVYAEITSKNYSCVTEGGPDRWCLRFFKNSTNPVSGDVAGKATAWKTFPTITRPVRGTARVPLSLASFPLSLFRLQWYKAAMQAAAIDEKNHPPGEHHHGSHFPTYGAVWSVPFFLKTSGHIGICAARQIRDMQDSVLGVAYSAIQVASARTFPFVQIAHNPITDKRLLIITVSSCFRLRKY